LWADRERTADVQVELMGTEMTIATWIAIALLTPFWCGLGLLILAWFGDVSPRLRPRVSRLFDWLGRTRAEPLTEPAISRVVAA
jgi:hypothetical protein